MTSDPPEPQTLRRHVIVRGRVQRVWFRGSTEREALQHIARGYTYREVSERLFISVKTVETHVSSVLRKLQLSNRHELARWAADRKLI